MKVARGYVAYLLVSLFFILGVDSVENKSDPSLVDGNVTILNLSNVTENQPYTKRVSFAPVSDIVIELTNIPNEIAFIVVQVHVLHYNVTMSYDKTQLNKVSNRSVFGSNIGLYVDTKLKTDVQVFLKNDNVHVIEALLVAAAYGEYAPIPGGCNMEFDTEIAPYQRVVNHNSMVVVDAQPAAAPTFSTKQASCEKHSIRHDMYMMRVGSSGLYGAHAYFHYIEMMLNVSEIVRNGKKIPPSLTTSPMRRVYSAYPGIGTVYAVVATYGNYSVAYVPAFSYACSPLVDPESCHYLNDPFSQCLCAIALLVGILSEFFGFSYKYLDKNLPSFVTGGIVGYTIALGVAAHTLTNNLIIALATAILATATCCLIRLYYPNNVARTLMITLPLGYFFASLTYYTMPVELTAMDDNLVFWATFVSVILLVCVLGQLCRYITELLCYSIFRPLMVILPIDYYYSFDFKYITINVIRRQTISGFNQAVISPPKQVLEPLLITLWVVLGLLCAKRYVFGGMSILTCYRRLMRARNNSESERSPLPSYTRVMRISDNPDSERAGLYEEID